MLNHVTLIGRMTADPELRYTGQNTAVCSFTLAVERDIKADGEKQTDFIDCVAWRQAAEFICKYFTKGNMTAVTGRLQLRDWKDKDGNKRRSAEVVTEHIYFCEGKKVAENGGQRAGNDKLESLKKYGATFKEEADDGTDLPF